MIVFQLQFTYKPRTNYLKILTITISFESPNLFCNILIKKIPAITKEKTQQEMNLQYNNLLFNSLEKNFLPITFWFMWYCRLAPRTTISPYNSTSILLQIVFKSKLDWLDHFKLSPFSGHLCTSFFVFLVVPLTVPLTKLS